MHTKKAYNSIDLSYYSSYILAIIICLGFFGQFMFYIFSETIYAGMLTVLAIIYAILRMDRVCLEKYHFVWIAAISVVAVNCVLQNNTMAVIIDILILMDCFLIILFSMGDAVEYETALKAIKVCSVFFALTVLAHKFLPEFFKMISSFAPSGLRKHISGSEIRGYTGLTTNVGYAARYIIAGLFAFASGKSGKKRFSVKDVIFFVTLLSGLFFTAKRGPTLFTVIAFMAVLYVSASDENRHNVRLILLLLSAVGIGMLIVSAPLLSAIPIVAKFAQSIERAFAGMDITSGRSNLYVLALRLFGTSPLTGIGWGKFKTFNPGNLETHNVYLQLLCETGIIGFIIFVSLLVISWVIAKKAYAGLLDLPEKATDPWKNLLFFSFAYQSFFLLYSLTGNPLYDNFAIIVYGFSCAIPVTYTFIIGNGLDHYRYHRRRTENMKSRRRITISAIIYTMFKRWFVMLVTLVVVFALGMGITFLQNNDKKKRVSNAAQTQLQDKNVDDILAYEEYMRESAYMNLDPNDLHIHYSQYFINWKEEGLDAKVIEAKNVELFKWIVQYYPSDEFMKEVVAAKSEYEDKALHEVIGVSRSATTLTFSIAYTDNYYVKDICEVIDSTLKKKIPEWFSIEGEFSLSKGPDTDKTVDGITAGYKKNQDAKITALTSAQAAATAAATAATSTNKDTKKEASMVSKTLSVLLIAFVCAVLAGLFAAVNRRRFDTSKDVSDLAGDDVICVLSSGKVSWLDKRFYRNDDTYQNPDTYLSISEKRMTDSGIKRVYLYNCTENDMTTACDKLSGKMKKLEIMPVSEDNSDFYLNVQDDEAVVILVKGGTTRKDAYMRITEHLFALGIKYSGVVFEV